MDVDWFFRVKSHNMDRDGIIGTLIVSDSETRGYPSHKLQNGGDRKNARRYSTVHRDSEL